MPQKHIALVSTGGTIAARAAQPSTLGDYTVDQDLDQLVAQAPGLEQLATLSLHPLYHIDSRDMSFALQHQLVLHIEQLLAQPDIDGVVITHGTDTLEETALLLHWCIKSTKPVVITGAMRPASALSADGPLNIYQAVQVASHIDAQDLGCMVVLNDQIHSARFVQKSHTTSPHAFSSPLTGPLGLVSHHQVYINTAPRRPYGRTSSLNLPEEPTLPPVALLYDHVDANHNFYKACVLMGFKAVVIASLGNGSLSPAARQGAEYCAENGVWCVRASRILNGAVPPSAQDQQFHTLPAHQFSPVAARTITALALANGANHTELAAYLRHY